MMRGYRLLKQSGQISLISRVKQALTEQQLRFADKSLSPFLMGAGYDCGEIVVRQYLLIRIGGLGLNQALLYASGKQGGKVIYPLPKAWRITISQHGFKVANFMSSLLWQLYIFGTLLYGALQIFKIILSGLSSLGTKTSKSKKHVYFAHLSGDNLPQGHEGEKSYDIVSWYLQWSGRNQNIAAVHHSVPNVVNKTVGAVELVYQTQMLPPLQEVVAVFKFLVWAMCACFLALIDCFRGRWWHAFLLNQTALSAQVRFLQKESLAREYLFNNSGWIYRPLWTYDAEQSGSKIIFYFYSTHCENFKVSKKNPPIPYGWKAASWPIYLVWDHWQADFVRKFAGSEVQVHQVGAIWFSSYVPKHLPDLKNGIAIFDVQPRRKSSYIVLASEFEYHTPAVANSFLNDIYIVLSKDNLSMVLKRKRNIGKFSHPSYQNFLNILRGKKEFIEIDCDIAAIDLINKCKGVISMPFTSTALIARELGKPSVYYDPTGYLTRSDVAAHGIPVLSSYEELRCWVYEVSIDREAGRYG